MILKAARVVLLSLVPAMSGADATAQQACPVRPLGLESQEPAHRAAILAARGELQSARGSVGRLLEQDPVNAKALLVGACVELELGNPDAAGAFAARMGRLKPIPGEVPILVALVGRRRTVPAEPMREALMAAWNETGRIGIADPLFPSVVEMALTGDALFTPRLGALGRLPRRDAFLVEGALYPFRGVRGSTGEEAGSRMAEAEFLAMHPDSNPFLLNLGLYGAGSGRSWTIQVARAILAARPDDGVASIMAIMAGKGDDAPLSVEEISRLEVAVRAPRFGFTKAELTQFQDEVRPVAAVVDPVAADLLARGIVNLAVSPTRTILFNLSRRIAATTGDHRARAAALAKLVGTRAAVGASLLEQMLGLVLLGQWSEMTGDPEAVASVKGLKLKQEEKMEALRPHDLHLDSWPLASLFRPSPGWE
jgi:hypothetical protein